MYLNNYYQGTSYHAHCHCTCRAVWELSEQMCSHVMLLNYINFHCPKPSASNMYLRRSYNNHTDPKKKTCQNFTWFLLLMDFYPQKNTKGESINGIHWSEVQPWFRQPYLALLVRFAPPGRTGAILGVVSEGLWICRWFCCSDLISSASWCDFRALILFLICWYKVNCLLKSPWDSSPFFTPIWKICFTVSKHHFFLANPRFWGANFGDVNLCGATNPLNVGVGVGLGLTNPRWTKKRCWKIDLNSWFWH